MGTHGQPTSNIGKGKKFDRVWGHTVSQHRVICRRSRKLFLACNFCSANISTNSSSVPLKHCINVTYGVADIVN